MFDCVIAAVVTWGREAPPAPSRERRGKCSVSRRGTSVPTAGGVLVGLDVGLELFVLAPVPRKHGDEPSPMLVDVCQRRNPTITQSRPDQTLDGGIAS
jgi:hypothetical protein